MTWFKGRREGGYFKKKLVEFKKFDMWLIKYPEGSFITQHNDRLDYGDPWRINIILKSPKKGGTFVCHEYINILNRVYIFNARHTHMVTEIVEGERLVLSIGFVRKREVYL